MKEKRMKQRDVFDAVCNLHIGDSFTDHKGNIITRVDDAGLLINGYDTMSEGTYLYAVEENTFWGRYPLHPLDYDEAKADLAFMQF